MSEELDALRALVEVHTSKLGGMSEEERVAEQAEAEKVLRTWEAQQRVNQMMAEEKKARLTVPPGMGFSRWKA